ncbi:DNA cytosine methyltransferase [Ensifer adhaerens]|uniref:DNA cytosine methyltransferase n=1 Tax=Ensifer adhaerens TaxID=106592 RepID=UPI001CBC24D6|nr:DNA (cytosine-5-)-methyltransferase [Ensifer adhaerens]MBZ7924892.1 DNA cytosine methyltransferase [Ensifer adhaerens]UAX95893.1 DNA cytosine methyltransferase [Ensifer adhaerens]UAY04765.1 DNA cytosine methyltransferase [Ensifer adhaerens]UAY10196.1 DNA cytosine methyltransferase [Ensifer adhaerens]
MNSKSEALAAAKKRITDLQSQMTAKILAIAAEVEKLMDVTPEREVRDFLRVTCNLPSSELGTYMGFGRTLKGSEALLQKARVTFPVLKALVAADAETRQEIVERMDIGARIDTKEIAVVRKRLTEAKLTPEALMAQKNVRLVAAAARKRSADTAALFREKLASFALHLRKMNASDLALASLSETVRNDALELREQFTDIFGTSRRSLNKINLNSPAFRVAAANDALKRICEGRFGNSSHYAGVKKWPASDSQIIDVLLLLSGHPVPRRGWVRGRNAITELPPHRYRLKAIELCAGAGGMSIGLERAGFEHVALFEYNADAAATLRQNRPDWNVVEADITKVDFKPYRRMDIDLVAGGVPCQPYSSEGDQLGQEDERDLLLESSRVIAEVKPKMFIIENVEGLLHAKHGDHVAEFLRRVAKAGYQTEINRIRAEDYGVAQERHRILLIGIRRELAGSFRMPPRFPERRSNLGDALLDLMSENGWTGAREWARQRRDCPVFDRQGNLIAHGVLASTVVTRRGTPRTKEAARWGSKGINIGGLPAAAPTDAEASKPGYLPGLTARMRARLQNFPDDWKFHGGKQSVADQIGNAVPARLAQAVGLAAFAAIRGVSFDWEAMLWPGDRGRLQMTTPALYLDQPQLAPGRKKPEQNVRTVESAGDW